MRRTSCQLASSEPLDSIMYVQNSISTKIEEPHFVLVTMSAAWHGGLAGAEQYVKDPTLRAAITSAMDFWFANDFTNPSCLDNGGSTSCPCGTPGLWNTNWFSNVCGLLPSLSDGQYSPWFMISDHIDPKPCIAILFAAQRYADRYTTR